MFKYWYLGARFSDLTLKMLNDGCVASENPGWLCVVIKVMDAFSLLTTERELKWQKRVAQIVSSKRNARHLGKVLHTLLRFGGHPGEGGKEEVTGKVEQRRYFAGKGRLASAPGGLGFLRGCPWALFIIWWTFSLWNNLRMLFYRLSRHK